MTRPGWYPDPGRRFEGRYWDGATWTDKVVTKGKGSAAPVAEGWAPPIAPGAVQEVPFAGERLDRDPDIVLEHCTVLGGAGWPLTIGTTVAVRFTAHLTVTAPDGTPLDVPYEDVHSIDIGGPGTVTSGGGFIGGGIGLEGAAVGMGVAALLNALTTRSETFTLVTLTTASRELFLLCRSFEPLTLRIRLSPVIVRLPERARTNA